MQLNITARHLDLTAALSDYVRRKIEKAERYLDIVWAQVILTVEKHRHIAEVIVHTPGNTFTTKGEAGDLYSAVDLATHKLDLHLSRVKDKKKDHRKRANSKNMIEGNLALAVAPGIMEEPAVSSESPSHTITEVNRVSLEPKSVNRAIRELNSNGIPFVLFINERTNQISAVYRKGKNGYGLMEVSE